MGDLRSILKFIATFTMQHFRSFLDLVEDLRSILFEMLHPETLILILERPIIYSANAYSIEEILNHNNDAKMVGTKRLRSVRYL